MQDTPSRPVSSHVSVTAPISQALDWTGRVLFKPFDVGKWFTLGFCAWLAWIGQGGGSGSGNWDVPGDNASREVEAFGGWVDANLALFLFLAAMVLLLIVGVIVLFTWLSSRGKLMFLDGVIHNRGAVVEPWNRFKSRGNSLFGFRVVVGLVALLVFGVLGGLMAMNLIAIGIEDSNFDFGTIAILSLWVAVLVGVGIVFGLISLAVNDFIVPIMWLRGCRVMDAWTEFRPLLEAYGGTLVLYVLMKILLAIVIVVISCLATCVTCCLAALPYLGTVILLPLYVFRRSYSLYFVSQLGPQYASLAPVDVPPAPPAPPTPPAQDAPPPPLDPRP